MGCGTPIIIRSNPEKVDVYFQGKKIGQTPCRIEPEFWREYVVVELKKDGYISQKNFILRKFLDSSNGFFEAGWPADVFYRLMDEEEAQRRKRWRVMD